MRTNTQTPMDYATRNAIAAVETLVVKKAIGAAEARSLLAAIAHERSAVSPQTDRHPDEEIDAQIAALQQAHPTLTTVQALEQVRKEHPDLYDTHVVAQRAGRGHPIAVEKQAPLTYAAVVKQAQAAQTPGQTTDQALAALALAHPNDGAYWEAHRRWHLSDEGLREHFVRDQGQG